MEKHFADCPFERYADDIIIHVKNERYAKQVLKAVKERMEECKLELHPEKTKLVYCDRKGRRKRKMAKERQFDFLGFTFRPRKVLTKDGSLMYGFSPSISRKSVKQIVGEMRNRTEAAEIPSLGKYGHPSGVRGAFSQNTWLDLLLWQIP